MRQRSLLVLHPLVVLHPPPRPKPHHTQELSSGQLTADDLDRAVVARLIETPPASYPQHPLHYLLACFARADGELRGLPAASAGDAAQLKLRATIVACQELLVSYAALILTGAGVVPEVGGSHLHSLALDRNTHRWLASSSSVPFCTIN